jgi:hypothetical protein
MMQGRRIRTGLATGLAAALACGATAVRAQEAAPQAPTRTEMVDGPALQVVFGERAVFHLDDKGEPVLDSVEKGPLAMAHPAGAVKETFAPPGPGKLALALDGSPEKKASYLKIWNGLDHPVLYHAGVLALVDGKLTPVTVKVCAAPAGAASSQTWPMPVAAAVVANFSPAADDKACQ